MLREVGKQDEKHLRTFLDQHATKMPRTMLRYSLEKLDKKARQHYMNLWQGRCLCVTFVLMGEKHGILLGNVLEICESFINFTSEWPSPIKK